MDYVVLARKLRPTRFADLIGQDTVVRALQGAVRTGRIAHAFLFTGSRGLGKTSTARILTKAINCKSPSDGEPCNACINCEEIARNASPDVYEIDAASNRGIDNIRELRENTGYVPVHCTYKTYIIDEVHMLTTESFNALLKTLEEPPPHVKFILATTSPHRIPDTILSRCQRFDFPRIQVPMLADYLEKVAQDEGIGLSRASLEAIARNAEGGVRDALTAVDQVVSFAGKEADDDEVRRILGLANHSETMALLEAIFDRSLPAALEAFNAAQVHGHDLTVLLEALIHEVKDFSLYLSLTDAQPSENSAIRTEVRTEIRTVMNDRLPESLALFESRRASVTLDELQQLFYLLLEVEGQLKRSEFAKACFEMGLVKACRVHRLVGVPEMLTYAKRLAEATAGGSNVGALKIGESKTAHSQDTIGSPSATGHHVTPPPTIHVEGATGGESFPPTPSSSPRESVPPKVAPQPSTSRQPVAPPITPPPSGPQQPAPPQITPPTRDREGAPSETASAVEPDGKEAEPAVPTAPLDSPAPQASTVSPESTAPHEGPSATGFVPEANATTEGQRPENEPAASEPSGSEQPVSESSVFKSSAPAAGAPIPESPATEASLPEPQASEEPLPPEPPYAHAEEPLPPEPGAGVEVEPPDLAPPGSDDPINERAPSNERSTVSPAADSTVPPTVPPSDLSGGLSDSGEDRRNLVPSHPQASPRPETPHQAPPHLTPQPRTAPAPSATDPRKALDEEEVVPETLEPSLCDDPRWRSLVEQGDAMGKALGAKLRRMEVGALDETGLVLIAPDPTGRLTEAELRNLGPLATVCFGDFFSKVSGDAFPIRLDDDTTKKARTAHAIAGRNRIETANRTAARRTAAEQDDKVQRLLRAFPNAKVVDITLSDKPTRSEDD